MSVPYFNVPQLNVVPVAPVPTVVPSGSQSFGSVPMQMPYVPDIKLTFNDGTTGILHALSQEKLKNRSPFFKEYLERWSDKKVLDVPFSADIFSRYLNANPDTVETNLVPVAEFFLDLEMLTRIRDVLESTDILESEEFNWVHGQKRHVKSLVRELSTPKLPFRAEDFPCTIAEIYNLLTYHVNDWGQLTVRSVDQPNREFVVETDSLPFELEHVDSANVRIKIVGGAVEYHAAPHTVVKTPSNLSREPYAPAYDESTDIQLSYNRGQWVLTDRLVVGQGSEHFLTTTVDGQQFSYSKLSNGAYSLIRPVSGSSDEVVYAFSNRGVMLPLPGFAYGNPDKIIVDEAKQRAYGVIRAPRRNQYSVAEDSGLLYFDEQGTPTTFNLSNIKTIADSPVIWTITNGYLVITTNSRDGATFINIHDTNVQRYYIIDYDANGPERDENDEDGFNIAVIDAGVLMNNREFVTDVIYFDRLEEAAKNVTFNEYGSGYCMLPLRRYPYLFPPKHWMDEDVYTVRTETADGKKKLQSRLDAKMDFEHRCMQLFNLIPSQIDGERSCEIRPLSEEQQRLLQSAKSVVNVSELNTNRCQYIFSEHSGQRQCSERASVPAHAPRFCTECGSSSRPPMQTQFPQMPIGLPLLPGPPPFIPGPPELPHLFQPALPGYVPLPEIQYPPIPFASVAPFQPLSPQLPGMPPSQQLPGMPPFNQF